MTAHLSAPALDAATLKAATLLSRDLALQGAAANYNLDDRAEQARSGRDLSRLFFRLAKVLETDLFVEAGAKDGASSRRARRLLDPKRIVAFEANPFTYQLFESRNADPALKVEYLHLALSDQPGNVTFNVLRNDDGKPRADGRSSLLKRESDLERGFEEVTVEATTIDTYLAGQEYERAALWVDVEGAAQQVLGGGRATLERAAVVIIEVEDRRFWGAEQWLRDDVTSYLYDRGLVAVARDFQSRYQHNIVFVRDELLTVDRARWAITLFYSKAYAAGGAQTLSAERPPALEERGTVLARELARRAVGKGRRTLARLSGKRG